MTDAPGIQSMDAVSAGDWLVVCRGPAQYKKEAGVTRAFYPPEYEGLLVKVLAVSPPIMLVKFYPFPMPNRTVVPVTTAWHWDRQRFSKATAGYVEKYLGMCGVGVDGKGDAPSPPKKRGRKKVESGGADKGVVS